jgi:hypothetical protein
MLDNKTIEKIKADSETYANLFKHGAEYRKPAYADGATEWAGRAEEHLIPALEWIKTYGPCDERTVKFIDNALAKYREVSNG